MKFEIKNMTYFVLAPKNANLSINLTMCMYNIYMNKSVTWMNKIWEWNRDVPYTWLLNIVDIAILPNQVPHKLFCEYWQTDSNVDIE